MHSYQSFNHNSSYDEFYDASSYHFTEERYGKDDEDRQWDSGGTNAHHHRPKKLPTVPIQNYLNKNRNLVHDDICSIGDESFRSVPTPRRKMPQVPVRRAMSKQSSLDEENYDGFSTPVNTSHRGASLPPTPTKAPKILTRMVSQNKTFNSLPPTPGRQLPTPRPVRRKNSVVKRANSAEQCKEEYYDYYNNGFYPPNDKEMYKVDFNFAYLSTDNLQEQEAAIDSTDNAKVKPYSFNQDNFYPPRMDVYEEATFQRKKLLGRKDHNSLLPQSTDSLESRDAELQDSFETAISSISSSIYQQQQQQQQQQKQIDSVEQIEEKPQPKSSNRGYLMQQESIDSTYYEQKLQSHNYVEETLQEDSYLEHEESIESYVEELPSNRVSTNRESPASVIHVEEEGMRRGSSQLTVIDPYHPRRLSEDITNKEEQYLGRKSSSELVRAGSLRMRRPASSPPRTEDELGMRDEDGLVIDEIKDDEEPVLEVIRDDGGRIEEEEQREEEEAVKPRSNLTALQRWHWAYNKIILQLNVSTFFVILRSHG